MTHPQEQAVCKWKVVTLTTQEVVSLGLHDAIVELDKRNMAGVLVEAGIAFPEEKRRKAFKVEGVTFIALGPKGHICGYLELVPKLGVYRGRLYIFAPN